jgi:hypothetical protein
LAKLVQFVLNNSPSPLLNGLAPITTLTGLSSTSPLTSVVEFAEARQTSLTEIRASQIRCADALIASLDAMHKTTSATAARYRALRRKSHDKRPNVNGPNNSVGDFVLVAKVSSKSGLNLRARWLDPRRVTAVEPDWNFEVEDLISGERAINHSARFKFYHGKSLNVTEDLIEHVAQNQSGFELDRMNDLRKCPVSLAYEVNVS